MEEAGTEIYNHHSADAAKELAAASTSRDTVTRGANQRDPQHAIKGLAAKIRELRSEVSLTEKCRESNGRHSGRPGSSPSQIITLMKQ